MAKMPIKLTVNGRAVEALAEPRTLLIHFLREELRLTGPHIGCDTSHCGACTVDLDGKSVKSCTVFVAQANGGTLRTIEGMAAADGSLHPLQEAFREHHGLQCGFCTPGMITRAYRLLQENPEPDRGRDPPGHCRQSLPLHRLSEHRQGDPRRCGAHQQHQGGRRMSAAARHRRSAQTEARGARHQPQARRGRPLHPGQRQLRRRHQAAGHAVRRLRALALWPRPHQVDQQRGSAGAAGRQSGDHRRRPEAAQARLDADAGRRRPGGAGRREGALPRPGDRLRRGRGPLHRRRRRRARRGRIRGTAGDHRSEPVDGGRRAGAARRPQRQDRRRARQAQARNHIFTWEIGRRPGHGERASLGRGRGEGAHRLSARPSLSHSRPAAASRPWTRSTGI